MVNGTNSSPLYVSNQSAAFARLASRVLEVLNGAVDRRKAEGKTLSSIAAKLGRDRSALTRALNGTSANLTLRTISDILWATDFDPQDFAADPIENICPNWVSTKMDEFDPSVSTMTIHQTHTILMDKRLYDRVAINSSYQKSQIEQSIR